MTLDCIRITSPFVAHLQQGGRLVGNLRSQSVGRVHALGPSGCSDLVFARSALRWPRGALSLEGTHPGSPLALSRRVRQHFLSHDDAAADPGTFLLAGKFCACVSATPAPFLLRSRSIFRKRGRRCSAGPHPCARNEFSQSRSIPDGRRLCCFVG